MAVTQSLTVREVSGSVNVSANTSVVEIIWTSTQTGESWNGYEKTASYYVSINGGAEQVNNEYYILPKNSTTTIVSERFTVKHREDGTGSVKVRTWMDTGISAGVIEKSKTLTLTTIPRETTLDSLSCDTKYFNGKMTYKYTPKSASYSNYCNIYLVLNGQEINFKTLDLGTQTASQKTATVTLSEEELSFIYNKLTKTNKGTLRFELLTLTYDSYIGYNQTKDITLYVPSISATQPTATMTLSPVSLMAAPFNSLYIKGRTKVDANFTNGKGKYGADIVSYELSVGDKTYESPYTSGYLSTAGNITIEGTVTDSRGISRTYTENITVIDYAAPLLLPASGESKIICARCDDDGNLTESGTHLKIKARRSYSKVTSDGVQNNFCSIQYRYKEESSGTFSPWVTILDKSNTSTDTIDTVPISGVVSSIETAYVVQLCVVDDMGNTNAIQYMIPTDFTTVDIPDEHKGRRIGFFRYVTDTDKDGAYFGLPIYGGSVDSLKLGTSLLATSTSPIDLNVIMIPGCYYSPGADYSQYIVNSPYTEGGFGLEVRELQSQNYIRQTMYYGRTTWIRHYNGTVWSEWDRCLMARDLS